MAEFKSKEYVKGVLDLKGDSVTSGLLAFLYLFPTSLAFLLMHYLISHGINPMSPGLVLGIGFSVIVVLMATLISLRDRELKMTRQTLQEIDQIFILRKDREDFLLSLAREFKNVLDEYEATNIITSGAPTTVAALAEKRERAQAKIEPAKERCWIAINFFQAMGNMPTHPDLGRYLEAVKKEGNKA